MQCQVYFDIFQMDAEERYDAMLQREREKMANEYADEFDVMDEEMRTSAAKSQPDTPGASATPATSAGTSAGANTVTPGVGAPS